MNSMKIAAISDVHIKVPHDKADELLCKFLNHPSVKSAQKILLLGDIFDLMAGPHEEYIRDFKHIFELLEERRKSGAQIYFFEGNHDVHVKGLFAKYWKNNEVIVSQYPIIEDLEGKTYYFSHGDEHEIDNLSYQRYKKFILSPPLRFVAEHVMPYAVLNFVGERASKISRKKGSRIFDEELVRKRFRNGVSSITHGKYNFVLGGHSHVKDVFEISPSSVYINNGYAMRSQSFILIDNHSIDFPSLA